MCCKQNNIITLLKGLITDTKNLPYYSSLESRCFSKATVAGSIISLLDLIRLCPFWETRKMLMNMI